MWQEIFLICPHQKGTRGGRWQEIKRKKTKKKKEHGPSGVLYKMTFDPSIYVQPILQALFLGDYQWLKVKKQKYYDRGFFM